MCFFKFHKHTNEPNSRVLCMRLNRDGRGKKMALKTYQVLGLGFVQPKPNKERERCQQEEMG